MSEEDDRDQVVARGRSSRGAAVHLVPAPDRAAPCDQALGGAPPAGAVPGWCELLMVAAGSGVGAGLGYRLARSRPRRARSGRAG